MVLFTKETMDSDKTVPVVTIPHMRFIGYPTRQGRTVSIQGSWEPERSVYVINTVGIPVDEALDDIVTKTRNVVIHMECNVQESLVKSLG